MKSLLLFCSGVNRRLLSRSPHEENNYLGMGGTVLFTTVLAFISGTAFGARMLHLSAFYSILTGLVFALGIFNIDRWLICTLRLNGPWRLCFLATLPRLLFSLVFSLVISDTLVLVLYETEINAQLARNQAAVQRQAQERQASSPVTQERNDLTARRDTLLAELKQRRAQRDAFYQAYLEEAEGKSGTGHAGKGPVFAEKGERLQQADQELKAFEQEVNGEIAQIQGRLDTIQKQQEGELNALVTKVRAADGPMAREEALLQLTEANPWLAFRRLLLEILIVSLDCMPVLCKLMLALSSRHPCEALQEAEEEQILHDARIAIAELHDLAAMEATIRLQDAQQRTQIELDKRRKIQQKTAESECRLAEEAIALWEDRERQNLLNNLDAYIT